MKPDDRQEAVAAAILYGLHPEMAPDGWPQANDYWRDKCLLLADSAIAAFTG